MENWYPFECRLKGTRDTSWAWFGKKFLGRLVVISRGTMTGRFSGCTWLQDNGSFLASTTYQSLPCHNTIDRDHSWMRQEWRRAATARLPSREVPRLFNAFKTYQSRSRAWSWFRVTDFVARIVSSPRPIPRFNTLFLLYICVCAWLIL